MAGSTRELILRLVGQADTAGLDKAAKNIGDIGDKSTKASGQASAFSGTLGKVGTIAGGIVAGAGLTALPGLLMAGAKGAAEDEASMARLRQAIDNTGSSSESYAGTIDDLIKKGQDLAFSDGEITDALSNLVSMTGSAEEGTARLTLAQDLARGANISLEQASKLLGKTTDENTGALRRLGVSLGEGATATDVLAAVQAKFGGQAQQYAQSAAGEYQKFQNQLVELQETVGAALIPIFMALAPVVLKVVEAAMPAFEAFTDVLTSVVEALPDEAIIAGLAVAIGAALAPSVIAATTAVWGFTAALLANPIGLIAVGVAGLAAGLVVLALNFDKVRDAAASALGFVGDFVPGVDALAGAIGLAVEKTEEWEAASNKFYETGGNLREGVRGLVAETAGYTVVINGVTLHTQGATSAITEEAAALADLRQYQTAGMNEAYALALAQGEVDSQTMAAAAALDTATEAARNNTSAYGDNELAANNVAIAALELELAQMKAAGASDIETAAVQAQIDALKNNNDVITAGAGLLDAFTTSLLLNGTQMGLTEQDAADLAKATTGLGEKYNDAEGAVKFANDALFFFGGKADDATQKALTLADELGSETIPKVNEFGDVIIELPDGKTVTISANDLATKPLNDIRDYYLPPKTVDVYANTNAFWNAINSLPTDIAVGAGPLPYLANGTRNFPGGWAVTGEAGPELVLLPAGTKVFSHQDSTKMLAQMLTGLILGGDAGVYVPGGSGWTGAGQGEQVPGAGGSFFVPPGQGGPYAGGGSYRPGTYSGSGYYAVLPQAAPGSFAWNATHSTMIKPLIPPPSLSGGKPPWSMAKPPWGISAGKPPYGPWEGKPDYGPWGGKPDPFWGRGPIYLVLPDGKVLAQVVTDEQSSYGRTQGLFRSIR